MKQGNLLYHVHKPLLSGTTIINFQWEQTKEFELYGDLTHKLSQTVTKDAVGELAKDLNVSCLETQPRYIPSMFEENLASGFDEDVENILNKLC